MDPRQLKVDVSRLRDDLHLLCGAQKAAHARVLQIIEDKPYADVFWHDGDDEDMVAPVRTAP